MEMCVAGGHASAQTGSHLKKPQRPVYVKSLKVTSPLGLYERGICHLQTTVKLDLANKEEVCYLVGVHRFVQSSSNGGVGEWISHATAHYYPLPVINTKSVSTPIDISTIQACWEKTDNSDFYEQLPQVGLRFGPTFRSLRSGWKNEKGMLFGVKVPSDSDEGYLIHPILADAMIQAIMLWTSKSKLKMKLQVPVQIGEFWWLQESTSASRYIYCFTNEEGKTSCILLDEMGVQLAQMSNVDFLETTVKLVDVLLQDRGTAMPKLWKETWKSSPGALQTAYDLTTRAEFFLTDEQRRLLADANDIGEPERRFHENLCHLARLHFVHAMYELGWAPKQGTPFGLGELVSLLPTPKEHFKRYIRFFLRAIADVGMLKPDPESKDSYSFAGLPPTQSEIVKGLQSVSGPEDSSRVEYRLITEIGRNLSKVWLGEVDPLNLLFPNDPAKAQVGQFYEETSNRIYPVFEALNYKFITPVFEQGYDAYFRHSRATSNQPVFRLLEVGAGTGGYSRNFLKYMESYGRPFEFYYTDVSPSFFNAAAKTFEKYSKNLVFKKLNMEEDPLVQGFCPHFFDLIVACEVIHIAKDVKRALRNLSCLLKPGGMFQIIETTQECPKVTQLFGLLEGYWQFEDLDLRPYHVTLTPEKWERVLSDINCDRVICTPAYNSVHSYIVAMLSAKEDKMGISSFTKLGKPQHAWLIFYDDWSAALTGLLMEKLMGVNRKVYAIERPSTCTESNIKAMMKAKLTAGMEAVGNVEGVIYLWSLGADVSQRDQSLVSLPLLSLVQEIVEFKVPPRLYVVTQGTAHVNGSHVSNPTAGTVHGLIKTVTNENTTLHLSCLDLPPNQPPVAHVDDIFYDLWSSEKCTQNIAFRENDRLCSKLSNAKLGNNEPLPLPGGCDRFKLLLPSTKLISDLEFGVLENYTLAENEVEVEVKTMALNFRDVFTVLKPIPQFEELNTVGLDFAGVISKLGPSVKNRKVGDRVIGMNLQPNLSMPSHIKLEERFLVSLPSALTFTEGATLPAVFSTALYCLVNVARMKRGEVVLIHTASGGVGLCAIQLAKRIGADIIATAGSMRKQNYLRSLGIQHVFHSRTTDFGKQILEITNGRGVDIVLNSITGEGFKEASLSVLANNGRFIEMSKLNVWTPEEVRKLRTDVFYKIVDLPTLEKWERQELTEQLEQFLHTDQLRPIPYERFDCVNIRGALNYLQKAKHIGKIVCVMPEVKLEHSKITAVTPLFNDNSTYLVTGGLGGIGLEVVKWMLSSGAKHIAIARRSPPNKEVAGQLELWNRCGTHVEAFSVDIGDFEQCRKVMLELRDPSHGFPQLRGVMHAAGVLGDSIIENQTWSSFRHCYTAKVDGSWNLHDLTKDLLLEHFVLFSSMSSVIGSPGQANHAAGNSFEDALAAYRRSIGLPATSINWSNWGEVGIATEVDFPGIRPLSTSQGILALETFMKTQASHLSVINADSFAPAVKLFPNLKHFLEDKRHFGDIKSTVIINSDELWNDVDNAEGRQGKLAVLKSFVKSTIKNILKMDQDEVVDDHTDFQQLGIDSLMMLEMKNELQKVLGSRLILNASQLKDSSNTDALSARLVDMLEGEEAEDDLLQKNPTMDELRELIREDSKLPEHIRPHPEMERGESSEIENVLLLGATGVLGPYLLRELSRRPSVRKIFCLIRKVVKMSPSERLWKRLQDIGLQDEVDMNKLVFVQGDITEDRFGLSPEEYLYLAKGVDTVINSLVKADHTAKYWRSPKNGLRTVNVKGTIRILEFAVDQKLKHVYHASTLGTVTSTDDDGCLSEQWQDIGAFDQLTFNAGYVLSKHISEQLCKQGSERGIPCKVFRHPLIGGDSKTGRCDYLTNHFVLRWLAYLKLKCMPDFPTPLIVMAVDDCAKLSLNLFLNPLAVHDVYNILHNDGGMDQTLIGIAEEYGINIQPVSFSEFVAKLKLEEDHSPLAPFKKMYEEEEETISKNFDGTNPALNVLKRYVEDSTNFFKSRKLPQLIENYHELESTEDVIRRDIRYLKDVGVFDKLGIKYLSNLA